MNKRAAQRHPPCDPALEQRVVQLEHQVERQAAVDFVLADRIATLEASNAELRAALGLSAPLPPLGWVWKTVKQVSFDTHYSESGVWGWVRARKVETKKIGGHVYINTETLPRKTKKRAVCFSSSASFAK